MAKRFLSGDEAFAEGVRLAKPDVISAYPITPQTIVVERLSEMVEEGSLKSEFIHVESEHSALSCAMGASAAGVRAFTATSSQGLLYMAECLYYASGGRFPIVMMNANRSTALPWNIYGDQRDSLSQLDSGWIQAYAENAQESLDLALMSFRIAEHKDVSSPFMVNLDGFILTHTYEEVDIPESSDADNRMDMNDTVMETGYDDYDDDNYAQDNQLPAVEEEYIEKRSMFVPMLAGVVIVVIIIATIFISGLMLNYFGNESDYKEFTVQNFVGQEYDNAKKLFSQYLVFEVKESIYSPMAENTILEQDLEPGEVVKPGHKIYVVLSKGPRMIEVPPLDNGFTEAQAKAILEEKKFSSQTRLVYSDTVQEGYVIKTEPEANTECKEGTTVLLFISRGKMTTQVRLPDVNGKKEDEARKTLEDLDLVVETQQRNSQMPEGTIVGMSLTANTLIQTGTKVTIYVSTGLPPTLTHEITIPFPDDANGVFAFKIYVDGTLNSEARDVDSKYTRSKNLSISASGGEKEITIYLVNQGNGKEAELGRYSYSFDDSKTKKQLSEDITGAFREVDGLKAAQQPVTQAPPPVTQAPPPETQAPETDTPVVEESQPENQEQQNNGE